MEENKSNAQNDGQAKAKAKTKGSKKKLGVAGFGMFTLVMLVIVLAALGSQVRSVWPLNLQLASPFEIAFDNGLAVVLDNSKTRISVIDENLEVVHITEISPEKQQGERYTAACVCDAGCYYSTSKVFDNSAYISSEQVYYLENTYAKPQLVYQRTYEESQRVFNSAFFCIYAAADGSDVLLVCQNADYSSIEIVSLSASPGKVLKQRTISEEIGPLYAISYSDTAQAYAFASKVGSLYIAKDSGELFQVDLPGFTCIFDCVWDSQGLLYAVESASKTLICINPDDGSQIVRTEGVEYTSVAVDATHRYVSCGTRNGFETYDSADFSRGMSSAPSPTYVQNEPLPYSVGLCVWTVAVWVAVVYLAVVVAVLLVKIILAMLRQGKVHKLFQTVIVCIAIIAIIGVSVLYSNQYYSLAVKNLENNTSAMCEDVEKTILPILINQKISSEDGISEDDVQTVANNIGVALSAKSESYATYNVSARIVCMAKDGDQTTSLTADADGYSVQVESSALTMENESFKTETLAAKDKATTVRKEYADGDYIVSYSSTVSDEGEIIGVAMIYCEITDLALSYRNLSISLGMTLLAVGGAIVLVVIEGKAALEARARRREERERDGGRPEVWSMRQINFWAAMATGLDSTIAILVAREMLSTQGIIGADTLAGVPIMLSTLGMFVGTALFGILSSRVTARKICIIGGSCAGVFFALSALVVFANNFLLYCVFRTAASFSISLLVATVAALPLRACDEQTQTKMFEDHTMSGISGVAFGTMVSGYVSEVFGNGAIYIACIVPLVLTLLLCWRGLPRALKIGEPGQNGRANTVSPTGKGTRKNTMLRMFFSPAGIAMVVFAMFPIIIINGYKSVFFPLFMSDAGISKVYINNIVVFSNVVVFMLSPQIARVLKGIDRWLVVVACLLFGAATCAWFMVNSTTAWAVLALVLLGVVYRVCTPSIKTLLPRAARHYGVSDTKANNTLGMLDKLECAFRSPILSTLAGFGQSIACFIVGIICVVGAVVFVLVSAKTPLRAKESKKKSEVGVNIEDDSSPGVDTIG